MSVEAALDQITRRSGLDRRDGPALWAYKVTDDELSVLQRELRAALQRGESSGAVSAGFCLFAACHFCREHDGGPWRWAPILEAIGCPWSPGYQLYDRIEEGLRYWRCGPVISTRFRSYYHRTLACQGGLPLKLLAGDSTHSLRAYFARLLRTAEDYGQPADELAESLAHGLPRTLRNDVVYAVASELIDAAIALRSRLEAPVEDPIEELDRIDPNWREQVPLRLDDHVAADLIGHLLRAPKPGDRSSNESFLELVLQLRQEHGPWLARATRLDPSATADALTSMLGLPSDAELPPYFQLSMLPSDGTRLPFATVQALQEQSRFRVSALSPSRPIRRGSGLFGAVRVVGSIGTTDIGIGEVVGGQPIPRELPWVLRGGSILAETPVRAFGSARAAGSAMLILLPEGTELEIEAGEAVLREAHSPEGRLLYELRGRARWEGEDGDVCTFATGVDEQEAGYVLKGRIHRFGFAGSEAFLGRPSVLLVAENGAQHVVPDAQLDWRPQSGGAWHSWQEEVRGDVHVRVREEGETRFRTSTTVIPRSLAIEVSTHSAGKGRIVVRHPDLCGLSMKSVDGIETLSGGTTGRPELKLEAVKPVAPTSLDLRLLFEGAIEATVEVPSPLQFRSFVGFDGVPLPDGEFRALDRLGTVRARAFEPHAIGLVVEGRRAGIGAWRGLGDLEGRDDGVYELSLDRIAPAVATLLAGTDSLDSKAELRIVPRGGHIGHPREIEVRRYDTDLEPVKEGGRTVAVHVPLGSQRRLGEDGLNRLRLEAVRMDDPNVDPEPFFVRTAPDTWEVPADLSAGPWLVLGWHGDWARLRPLLITVPGEPPEGLDRLQAAVWIADPEGRADAIGAVLEELERDHCHALWGSVVSMTEYLGVLPAMTFDVVRHVATRPLAATMLALKMAGRLELLWNGLQELPFLWSTIPLRAWMQAGARLRAFCEQPRIAEPFGGSQLAMRAILERFAEAAPRLGSFVNVILELWASSVPGVPAPPAPHLAFVAQAGAGLQYFREKLRQRNSERRWPEPDLRQLVSEEVSRLAARALASLSEPPAAHGYRAVVIEAPAVAAALAVSGEPASTEALFQLRLLRDFDPEWFQQAHALYLTILVKEALRADPEAFHA